MKLRLLKGEACAVNAASLALVDAGVEMRDVVAATTVGYGQHEAARNQDALPAVYVHHDRSLHAERQALLT